MNWSPKPRATTQTWTSRRSKPLAGLPLSAGTDASQGCIERGGILAASATLNVRKRDLGWLLASSAAGGEEKPSGHKQNFHNQHDDTSIPPPLPPPSIHSLGVARGRGLTAEDCPAFALADALNPKRSERADRQKKTYVASERSGLCHAGRTPLQQLRPDWVKPNRLTAYHRRRRQAP